MSTVIIRMGVAKVKTIMVYMFDHSQVGCLMPVDHKYPVHVLTQLWITIALSSHAYVLTKCHNGVPLAPLYEGSFGPSILQ